jgi:hypothetical protein
VQFYCNSCRTPFEKIKGDDVMKDAEDHFCADEPLPHASGDRLE